MTDSTQHAGGKGNMQSLTERTTRIGRQTGSTGHVSEPWDGRDMTAGRQDAELTSFRGTGGRAQAWDGRTDARYRLKMGTDSCSTSTEGAIPNVVGKCTWFVGALQGNA